MLQVMTVKMLKYLTGKMLIYEGYLEEKAVEIGFGAIVQLSSKGYSWMRSNNKQLKVVPNNDMMAADKPAVTIRML